MMMMMMMMMMFNHSILGTAKQKTKKIRTSLLQGCHHPLHWLHAILVLSLFLFFDHFLRVGG